MFKIGIIGAGDIVKKAYLPLLSKRDDCKLIGICNSSIGSSIQLSKQYSLNSYNNYKELIQDKSIDTILICTPTHLHFEIAEYAISKSKNILLEKPLTTNFDLSNQLIQKSIHSNTLLYAAYNNFFREENQNLYHKVVEGKIGEIELIDFEWFRTWRYADKIWLYNKSLSGGGVVMDLGCHLLFIGLSLISKRKTFKVASNLQFLPYMNHKVEDSAFAIITINGSITFNIKVGWAMNMLNPSRVNLQVYGSKGSISNQDYHGSKSDGYSTMIEDFFLNLKGSKKQDLNIVYDSLLLLDSIYKSFYENKIIEGYFESTNQ